VFPGPPGSGAGSGDSAEGDFEAEGFELADVVVDLAAALSAALVVVGAGGADHYAACLTSTGGFEVELVATGRDQHKTKDGSDPANWPMFLDDKWTCYAGRWLRNLRCRRAG
jgi:hypothetical protein